MRCSAYHRNSALYPVIELIERVVLQFEAGDDDPRKMAKLEAFLLQSGLGGELTLALFLELLSIPLPETVAPLPLSPAAKKKKTEEALLQALLHRAASQPLLLVIEDLHWADTSTLEWLDLFIGESAGHTIFALCTTRPPDGYRDQPGWARRANMTPLVLTRLSRDQIEVICRHRTKGKILPAAVLEQIKTKTDGVPLFVEELTQMIIESDLLIEQEDRYELRPQYQSGLPRFSIPSTLQDSLLARLDKLAPVKELVQVGAIIGREFSFELLQAVTEKAPAELARELAQLVEAELLYQRGPAPEAQYIFKHALIQDAAYSTLLKSSRGRWHRRIAEVMEDQFSHLSAAQPEIIAHHLTEADVMERALLKWEEAGNMAHQRFANFDSVHHLEKAISTLAYIANQQSREAKELDLLLPYNSVTMITKGWTHPKVKENSDRILELCENNSNPQKALIGYYGLGSFHHVQGTLRTALGLYEKGLEMAETMKNDPFTALFYAGIAHVSFYLGDFKLTLHSAQNARRIYDPKLHQDIILMGSGDLYVYATGVMANALLCFGFPDRAQKMIDEISTYPISDDDMLSNWWVINDSIVHYYGIRDLKKGIKLSRTFLPKLESSGELATLNFMKATDYVLDACINGGGGLIEKVEAFLDQLNEQGMSIAQTLYKTWLLEAYLKEKDYLRGMSCVDQIMEIMVQTDERTVESEMYRCKGALHLLKKDEQQKAENAFLKSIEIAQGQSAKWFELKAANSLARLWQSQGKIPEAYHLLHGVYSWFTEGFDTIDMRESKELLEELNTQLAAK